MAVRMYRAIALVFLLCALVVPRTAWSVHLAGHDDISSQIAIHTHQGDHAHDHGRAGPHATDEAGDDDSSGDGLTHDHNPPLSLASAWLIADEAVFEVWFARSDHGFDRTVAADAHSSPESVLRPPRTA